jgi:hypothetical protein
MILRYLIVLILLAASSHAYAEAYFVHGTGCDNSVWNEVVRKEIRDIFGHQPFEDQVELFGWSGDNNTFARIRAAEKLLAHIQDNRSTYAIDEPCITLIGHSHGGNIILLASESLKILLGSDIEINIITLNTPNVVGGAQLDDPLINHYHVYCPKDKIIPFGGFNKTGQKDLISSIENRNNEYSYARDVNSGKQGSTHRTFNDAIVNIAYADQYFMKGVKPIIHWSCHRGMLPKNVEQWSSVLKVAYENQMPKKEISQNNTSVKTTLADK